MIKPYYKDLHNMLYNLDFRNNDLLDESIQCVVTSPPYWGLRKYSGEQELIWGGDKGCRHQWIENNHKDTRGIEGSNLTGRIPYKEGEARINYTDGFCSLCGAWKGAYGLEPTPEMYIEHTIEILREIRRVLRKDGVVFLNLGDSYSGSWGAMSKEATRGQPCGRPPTALKQHKRPLLSLRQEDATWLAGLIDGEGSLMIHCQNSPKKKPVYQANIQIAMSHRGMLDKAHKITGLGDVVIELKRKTKSGLPIYRWAVRGQQAIPILENIYPYLIIKRKQARLLYAVANDVTKRDAGNGRPLTQDILTRRKEWYNQVKLLNHYKDIDISVPEIQISQGWLKPKDLCLIPFRVALEAQRDGWWARSVIIWSKNNPMPESVTDRPTESHEYILMLTKSKTYYWDADAVREPNQAVHMRWLNRVTHSKRADAPNDVKYIPAWEDKLEAVGRNIRSVWEFPTQPYPEAHFAVFPEKLPELCIKAATPEVGCCSKCGAPWERITSRETVDTEGWGKATKDHTGETQGSQSMIRNEQGRAGSTIVETLGWQPTCKCNADKVPSVVLDPFAGAGTTLWVAKKLNRKAVGYEISEEYCQLALDRNRQQVLL